MMFDTSTQNMMKLQSGLYKLQNQMSTGRSILTPSDDPVAAAQALEISQRQSVNNQFIDNQANAASQLSGLESTLRSASDLVSNVMVSATEANNPNISATSRQAIVANINESFNQLLGLANSTDGQGQHMFSGLRGNTTPFTVSGSPGNRTITYGGDDGARQLQVDSGRIMDVSAPGSNVFGRIPQGNGQFSFSDAATNTGTGTLGPSSNISGYDGSTYKLTFTAPGVYTLDVTTASGSVTSTPGQVYTPGSDIVLPSAAAAQQIKINISGTPAVGDTFSVDPAANQDIFTTLDKMVKALNANVSSSATTKAAYQNQITQITQNLSQAFDHLLTAQTSVGARQLELQNLGNAGSDRNLQYQADLSKLQDLDYTKATSDMANQKMVLEAAQLSFKQISQMSLFTYL
jgi:flagellar hook-associated protein 3 FlgL